MKCYAPSMDSTASLKLKQSLPDVVISDLRMPNMSGFEFLSVVRRRFPQIAVIAISGEFAGIDVPESVLADAFFEKGQYSSERPLRENYRAAGRNSTTSKCRT